MGMTVTRRAAALGLAGTLAAPMVARGQRAADPRVLRFVPQAGLSNLDPIASLAGVAVNHGFYVWDTLYGIDAQMRPRPQMAEGHSVSDDGLRWTIRLREGLAFHDGTPVRSRDCAASLRRWGNRDTFGRTYAAAVRDYETPDDRTLVIVLSQPFPLLLDAIAKAGTSPAFIMPERIAATDALRPITEIVGSGPYRFLAEEFNAGSRAAYAKFDRYRPRAEAPEWTSGGKVAHFERIEWHMLPDPATASASASTTCTRPSTRRRCGVRCSLPSTRQTSWPPSPETTRRHSTSVTPSIPARHRMAGRRSRRRWQAQASRGPARSCARVAMRARRW